MLGQFFHRHPIDAGLTRVLSNSLQRGPKVLAFARPLHQVARSWALVSTSSRWRFHTQARPLRLHPAGRLCARTWLRFLWHGVPEVHGRLALLFVRPFAAATATTASADFSPRRSSRSSSPFQAQGEISPGKNIGLRRTTAGSTSPRLGHESFAASCPLALLGSASYPVPVRRPAASLPASFTPASRNDALRFASLAMTSSREDFHLQVDAHAGRTSKTPEPRLRGSLQRPLSSPGGGSCTSHSSIPRRGTTGRPRPGRLPSNLSPS